MGPEGEGKEKKEKIENNWRKERLKSKGNLACFTKGTQTVIWTLLYLPFGKDY